MAVLGIKSAASGEALSAICNRDNVSKRGNMTFKDQLQSLLNCHSAENRSNTPDFILAKYLIGCLNALDVAVNMREDYYGREHHHLGDSVEGSEPVAKPREGWICGCGQWNLIYTEPCRGKPGQHCGKSAPRASQETRAADQVGDRHD